MAKTICKAKNLGEVRERGKASLEWHDEDGTPHYYCQGYKDASTEELLPTCRNCRDNVIFAQEDLEKSILQEVGN
ncbi:hypothetical protein KQI61_05730 [Anaerocolumna aminovalerica]|uniref:hypothetical protein n=1 Tax=Anaerocolumna aminovalerica TaxID=1527 RepID=UPI001C0EA43D|nr:hypothetical protein [Anaerocolumna aminovalerica]MBU5331690.1 hypothetical protein [Anaerocolumna aminovalerica]